MTAAARGLQVWGPGLLRRTQDIWVAVAAGALVALLMLALPMEAALASALVGAFVILAFVDTRVAVLALVLVRATVDVTATVPLVAASGAADVNAAAMMSLLVIALGVAHIATNRIDILRMPLVKPFLLFLGIAVLGIALAPDKARAIQDWLRVAGAFSLYVLVVDLVRTRADLRWFLRVMLASATIPVAVGVYQYFTGTGNRDTEGFNRIMGTFTHPSPYASYLVTLVPFAVVFFLHTNSRLARVVLAAAIPVMVFSIYATQTRIAWIGLLVVVMVFMSTRARWTLFLVPVLAVAVVVASPSIRQRFDEATSETGSVFWRQQQWQRAINVASPPELVTVGAGLGAVDETLGNFAHNEYVRLLVETGALGLIVTIVLYKRLFELTLEGYRRASTPFQRDLMLALLMAFASRVVIAGSDNIVAFPVLEWYFWAAAGLIVVMSGRHREELAPDAPVLTYEERAAA
jgi:O-antigen ligase